jgi:hypothetical protein
MITLHTTLAESGDGSGRSLIYREHDDMLQSTQASSSNFFRAQLLQIYIKKNPVTVNRQLDEKVLPLLMTIT